MGSNVSNLTQDGSQVQWNRTPFQQGASRFAYQGTWIKGPRRGQTCVVKTFKRRDLATHYNIEKEIKCYEQAHLYATWFNRENMGDRNIKYVMPIKLSVRGVSFAALFQKNFKTGDHILVEPFLTGAYHKFNSNSGWRIEEAKLLQAFSHFTFHRSGGELILCDLQGIKDQDEYVLTDPAIHSMFEGQYGMTDLGESGIQSFFASHQCNKFCQAMKLKKQNFGPSKMKMIKETSYTFGVRH
jgi:hypothetical protein